MDSHIMSKFQVKREVSADSEHFEKQPKTMIFQMYLIFEHFVELFFDKYVDKFVLFKTI